MPQQWQFLRTRWTGFLRTSSCFDVRAGLVICRRYFSALSATTLMGASSLSIFFGLVLSPVVSTTAAGFAASFDDEAAAAVAELLRWVSIFYRKSDRYSLL